MLGIHFAILVLLVVTARAGLESGRITVGLPVDSNISQDGAGCSCPTVPMLQQIMKSISLMKCAEPLPLPKREDYGYFPRIGAYKLHTRAVKWNVARHICEDEGGHLAIINSQAEANVLARLLNQKREGIVGAFNSWYAAIGFHDLYQDGEYETVHGQSLEQAGYTRWSPGEPNNMSGKEHCGSMSIEGELNDADCQNSYAFICELSNV